MTSLALPFAFLPLLPGWHLKPAELRIDVDPGKASPADTLAPVHERMRAMHDRLQEMPGLALGDPGLRARFREADGELYVYIEDLRRDMLVGYTVFNRLIELSRRADRHIRAPHSQYHPAWQRRGLASAVYRWALGRGICLMSGARQSPGAHALWQRLSRHHEAGFADLRCKQLSYLGREVAGATLDALHTRMFLLGGGWTLERFRRETQMG
ncbi:MULTISPECIES: N-acetyltransferase [unclassified Variovorax]|jgi:GNAT superfamily N-acetyltransferase|uniref:N-acetyltransferase n=1 Tax=unclassified Variovorax TaxID=663243 RepID=UPI000F7DCC51|nr:MULTISPECIES: N-acetyltransferase [unclassified Variovorax]RSZ34500.1 N-acetyltransferase [Variovorax sp. 553]RSZ34996.1 N-acetyltransferase [Variovorax sp. 679]